MNLESDINESIDYLFFFFFIKFFNASSVLFIKFFVRYQIFIFHSFRFRSIF